MEKWLDIPRAFDQDGKVGNDLYAFCLKHAEDKDRISEGDVVESIHKKILWSLTKGLAV